MIQPERIQKLNDHAPNEAGTLVLYWMQQTQRARDNHALTFAIQEANQSRLPLLVYFGLTPAFPEARRRHYRFMLEGLKETFALLHQCGLGFRVHCGDPVDGLIPLATRARLVVTDRGYLRIQREWRQRAASALACPLIQIESDLIVPIQTASDHAEYMAATLRPKINRLLPRFLLPCPVAEPRRDTVREGQTIDEFIRQADALLARFQPDGEIAPAVFTGGTREADRHLARFTTEVLPHYAEKHNDPGRTDQSNLSPYLHFGQISALRVALEIQSIGGPAAEAFLEELIVRRELAANFVYYQPAYDRFAGLPAWARESLARHASDRRTPVYSLTELDRAQTADPFWNAAQQEMRLTGKMQGYMRMYWGKQILGWSPSPAVAFQRALTLNNRYFLDGRDPNGFAGVAWCFGLHDRPWTRRPIFGSVRYMNAAGLRRKFDMDAYLRRIAGLPGRAESGA